MNKKLTCSDSKFLCLDWEKLPFVKKPEKMFGVWLQVIRHETLYFKCYKVVWCVALCKQKLHAKNVLSPQNMWFSLVHNGGMCNINQLSGMSEETWRLAWIRDLFLWKRTHHMPKCLCRHSELTKSNVHWNGALTTVTWTHIQSLSCRTDVSLLITYSLSQSEAAHGCSVQCTHPLLCRIYQVCCYANSMWDKNTAVLTCFNKKWTGLQQSGFAEPHGLNI